MLTKRQREILLFIQNYQRTTGGVSPTYVEIGEATRLTAKSTVCRHVDQLEERGFIRRLTNGQTIFDAEGTHKVLQQMMGDTDDLPADLKAQIQALMDDAQVEFQTGDASP